MATHAALSPSRTKDFKQCPLLFRFRSVDRLSQPPTKEQLRGTIVHSVLEHLFDYSPQERTPETAHALLPTRWNSHVEAHPDVIEIFTSENELAEWMDSAGSLLDNYFHMENPQFLQPVARERFVNARLTSGLAIRGIVDRLDATPTGEQRVVDYKTGKSPAARFQDEALFQMRFYALALKLATGTMPIRTQLVYLKDGRTLTYDPTPEDLPRLAEDLNNTWELIEKRLDSGDFEPHTSRLCDWCYFKRICPAWGGTPPDISADGVEYMRTAKA
ncbi:RecB family exonuclease [Neoactinobaculum massilliense]|uniref:RecB family exonuclease n=1 Tax=Neoactinobaculum massilliense TaxID=2364794 RepID=UPI000F53B778|nr:PD-(D/E)XK nuclease family protein [Neoactinobaculum massilliense]